MTEGSLAKPKVKDDPVWSKYSNAHRVSSLHLSNGKPHEYFDLTGTRIADIASEPQIWGSPRVDDDRNGPGAPILSSFRFLDTMRKSILTSRDLRTSPDDAA